MQDVKVYGADWCPMTRRAIQQLQERGVPFRYVNVESEPEASAWVKRQSDGAERKPTIDIDGEILVAPSERELDAALA